VEPKWAPETSGSPIERRLLQASTPGVPGTWSLEHLLRQKVRPAGICEANILLCCADAVLGSQCTTLMFGSSKRLISILRSMRIIVVECIA